MEDFRNANVKVIINKYPKTYEILKDYDFDCLKCHGKCMMKEIVDMEQLDMEQEMDMYSRLIEEIEKAENE